MRYLPFSLLIIPDNSQYLQMDIITVEAVVAGAPSLHSLLLGDLSCLQNLASIGTSAPHGEVNQANRQIEIDKWKLLVVTNHKFNVLSPEKNLIKFNIKKSHKSLQILYCLI